MSEQQEEIWRPAVKSQEFMNGPRATHSPGQLLIAYDYELPNGQYAWSGLKFIGVYAFIFTNFESCSDDQVLAYDRLIRVLDSHWIIQLRLDLTRTQHFRIFFDDVGAYDIAALGYEVLKEV